jgi:hypothetical protein
LLRLARITIAQDDQPAVRDLLRQHALALDDGIRDRLEQRRQGLSTCSGLLGILSLRSQLLLDQRR